VILSSAPSILIVSITLKVRVILDRDDKDLSTIAKYFPQKVKRLVSKNTFLEKPLNVNHYGRFIWNEYQKLIKKTYDNMKIRIVTMKGMFPIHTLEEFILFYTSNRRDDEKELQMIHKKNDNFKIIDMKPIIEWCWRTVLICKALCKYAHSEGEIDFDGNLKKLRHKRPNFYSKLTEYFGKKGFDLSLGNWNAVEKLFDIYNRYLGYLVFIQKSSLYLSDGKKNYYQYAINILNSKHVPLPHFLYMNFVNVFGINMIVLAVELCFFIKKKDLNINVKSMLWAVWIYRKYLDEVDSDGGIYFDVVLNLFIEIQQLYIKKKNFVDADYVAYLFPGRPEFTSFGNLKVKDVIDKDIKTVKSNMEDGKKQVEYNYGRYKKFYLMHMILNPDHEDHLRIEGYE
jgi:hypothetical protein